ncbi:hypothetical protein NM688_g7301 [Phlebia brevispora]|uniref:Uncharacterized protein n=1 Tax=Phlebia brevispora TaxID=194682 RepID=A0ACC1S738_9APHY|nr:hypothetical protein NM688_g7301 [Phlebia brevispora]
MLSSTCLAIFQLFDGPNLPKALQEHPNDLGVELEIVVEGRSVFKPKNGEGEVNIESELLKDDRPRPMKMGTGTVLAGELESYTA